MAVANLRRKPVLLTDPKTGAKIKAKSSKWWSQYKDANGRLRRHPLSVDERAAQAMLHEIVRKVEPEKAGLIDRMDDERKRPLTQHLDEYKSYLRNKGVTEKQLRECTTQIRKMCEACKWTLTMNGSGMTSRAGKSSGWSRGGGGEGGADYAARRVPQCCSG